MTYNTCSRIEAVITGLTRNQFVGNHTWVRIPPSADKGSYSNIVFIGEKDDHYVIRGKEYS